MNFLMYYTIRGWEYQYLLIGVKDLDDGIREFFRLLKKDEGIDINERAYRASIEYCELIESMKIGEVNMSSRGEFSHGNIMMQYKNIDVFDFSGINATVQQKG